MNAISSKSRDLTLLLACQAVTTLGMMVLVPIMPLYVGTLTQIDSMGAARWSSLALAAPALGVLCLAPLAGRWCDRFGYRPMLLLSLMVFIASMLVMACSASIYGFILGRLLLGTSTIGIILTAFIGHISNDSSRGRALGLQESAVACGALVGPVLGGIMIDYWSLKPLLLFSALFTAVVGIALWSRLGKSPKTAPDRTVSHFVDLRTLLSKSQGNLRNWMVAGCLAQAAAFALVNVFALFLAARFPATEAIASTAGLLHAFGWFAAFLAGPMWGHLNDRGIPQRYFILASVGCTLSIVLMTLIDQIWIIALLRIIQGACHAALAQTIVLICIRQLPVALHGYITGLSGSFMVAGQLLGPIMIMLLMPILSPVALLWPVAALFLAAGLIAAHTGLPKFIVPLPATQEKT